MTPAVPAFDDVCRAATRIGGHVFRTPVVSCDEIDRRAGARIWLKCENLQRTGSFKLRGATNAVLQLEEHVARIGVAAHSSGNHAAALALAARNRGIPATVVMPSDVRAVKREAVEQYGGRVVFCEPTLEARERTLQQVLAATGATELHPYDNSQVIAGAGTAALELLEDHPAIGLVVAPVSGGGLLSGTAIAAHGLNSAIRIRGAEPEGADDAARSLAAGEHQTSYDGTTIADGLRATLSERTFAILSEHAEGVTLVSDMAILDAERLLFEHAKLVVEPSGAAAVGAVLSGQIDLPEEVGVIVSGGNVEHPMAV